MVVAFMRVTNAHGPSSQPTVCGYPTCLIFFVVVTCYTYYLGTFVILDTFVNLVTFENLGTFINLGTFVNLACKDAIDRFSIPDVSVEGQNN